MTVERLSDVAMMIELFGEWNEGSTDRRLRYQSRDLWASDLRAAIAALSELPQNGSSPQKSPSESAGGWRAYTVALFPECSESSLRDEWARMPARQKSDCMNAMRAAITAALSLEAAPS